MDRLLTQRTLLLMLVADDCRGWLLDGWEDCIASGGTAESALRTLLRDVIDLQKVRWGIDVTAELHDVDIEHLVAPLRIAPQVLPFPKHLAATLVCYGYHRGGSYDHGRGVLEAAISKLDGDFVDIFAEKPGATDRSALAGLLERLKMCPAHTQLIVVRTLRDFCSDCDLLVKLLGVFNSRGIFLISIAEKIDTTEPGGVERAFEALEAMRHQAPGPDDATVCAIVDRLLGDERVRDIKRS